MAGQLALHLQLPGPGGTGLRAHGPAQRALHDGSRPGRRGGPGSRGLAGRLSDRGAWVPPALVLVLVALGLVALPDVLVGLGDPGGRGPGGGLPGADPDPGAPGRGRLHPVPAPDPGGHGPGQRGPGPGGGQPGRCPGWAAHRGPAGADPGGGGDLRCPGGAGGPGPVASAVRRLARPWSGRAGPGRGQASFPWPGLGWGLIYVVLLVYAWHLLDLGSRPGPELRFDEARLTEVSGSKRFTLVEQPLVHYLGFAPGELEASTLTLASAAAGPGVSGFAGPIELLLAVGRDGVLRGVRIWAPGRPRPISPGSTPGLRGSPGRTWPRAP